MRHHFSRHKYEYPTPNIIVGMAELSYDPKRKGWVIHGGSVIRDKHKAIEYARKVHELYIANCTAFNRKRHI